MKQPWRRFLTVLVVLCVATTLATPEVGERTPVEDALVEVMPPAEGGLMDAAREAAVSVDKAVATDDGKKSVERKKIKTTLNKLIPSMKAAAVGVTEKAAVDAVKPAMQPFMQKYYATIRQRMSAEKEEATAKALYDAAMEEKTKQDKVAQHALRTVKVAANAARQQSEYKHHAADATLDGMKAREKVTTAAATVKAKHQALERVHQQGASKVAPYSAQADAAEKAAAAAKAALENAEATQASAAKLKEEALAMKTERDHLQAATRNSVVPEQVEVETGTKSSTAEEHPYLWAYGKHVALMLVQHVSSAAGAIMQAASFFT